MSFFAVHIIHYLDVRVELLSSPLHAGSGTSCHSTPEREVSSFLNLGCGGDDGHLRQTWEQRAHRHRSLMWWWSRVSLSLCFFSSFFWRNRMEPKNTLICFLATRWSFCMWLKWRGWAHSSPTFHCTCFLKALLCRIAKTNGCFPLFDGERMKLWLFFVLKIHHVETCDENWNYTNFIISPPDMF